MLCHRTLLRCSTAAAQTLTAWLCRLAEQAEALPPLPEGAASTVVEAITPSPSFSTSSVTAAKLFRDIEEAATHANAMRETDTLFSILHCLWRKRYFPGDADTWVRLADQLLPYGGIEAGSVLHYPAQSASTARRVGHVMHQSEEARSAASHTSYSLPITRETLLMTGGVVPLSMRVPCGDGRMVALFLDNFIRYIRARQRSTCSGNDEPESTTTQPCQGGLAPEVAKAVRTVSKTVLNALHTNASTLQWELLISSLLDYLELLHELDLQNDVPVLREPTAIDKEMDVDGDVGDVGETETADNKTVKKTQRTRLLQRMADGLAHRALTKGAHGARVVVYYLSDRFSKVVDKFQSSDAIVRLLPEDAQLLYWMQQRYLISLTRSCMRAVYLYYTADRATPSRHGRGATSPASLTTDVILTPPMNGKIESLHDQIDVMLQQNTNAKNPLQITETAASQLKDIHTLALLRALRMEEAAPDAYLRRALEVVDRVPVSMAIEDELIAGKVRLLDLDSDTVDEDGRAAVYNDLLLSLRRLVEMRPRFARQDDVGLSSTAASSTGKVDGDAEMNSWEEESGEVGGSASVRLDAVTQGIIQRAHEDVITAFCAAHSDEWLNEAYNILVTHKYNGLKITKELILPVLEVFSRRGDSRAFNVVDLCVLYSNESVDMNTIALLFRTCAVAGDHFRARTFLQLLNDIIPGFLVKCPTWVKESLQELKVLDPPPQHLFVSAEDDLVQSTLGTATRTVRRLPDVA